MSTENKSAGEREIGKAVGAGRGLRIAGHFLVIAGFVWLVASAILFQTLTYGAVSKQMDALPRQETYTRHEVYGQISSLARRMRERVPWIIEPAVMMLVGAYFLASRRP